jgi:hypothetical protein
MTEKDNLSMGGAGKAACTKETEPWSHTTDKPQLKMNEGLKDQTWNYEMTTRHKGKLAGTSLDFET